MRRRSCLVCPARDLPASRRSRDARVGFVGRRGFGSTSEYVRALIRRDQDRQRLRDLLLAGAESGEGTVADAAFFADLRARARGGA
mgnify:CR=1 FL=1